MIKLKDMREIVFRGKTNKTLVNGKPSYTNKGGWVKGSLNISCDGTICTISDRQSVYTVRKETVGQYTGLKDKNGTRVYEGDICVHSDKENYPRPLAVEWIDKFACFAFVDKQDYDNMYFYQENHMEHVRVVGNIYDNKSLLK